MSEPSDVATAVESNPPPVLAYRSTEGNAAWGIIACRILALWMFAQAIHGIGQLTVAFASMSHDGIKLAPSYRYWEFVNAIPPMLWGILGFVYWSQAPRIGARICAQTSTIASPSQDLMDVAFVAVGAFVLADAVPVLTTDLVEYSYGKLSSSRFFSYNNGQLMASGIKCAIGLWLLLGSRGISRVVMRLRS